MKAGTVRVWGAAVATSVVLSCGWAGCRTSSAGSGAGQPLESRAGAGGPGDARPDWTPPPGVPSELAVPVRAGDAGYAKATLGLDATIDELAQREVAKPVKGPAASAQRKDEALGRYISGREKLLGGDREGALEDLTAATRFDPAAPEPWRELAAAQLAVGNRSGAASSFEAAAARGLAEAPALEYLGRIRLERGDAEGAATAFARAWTLGPRASDPGLPAVILAGLGRTLLQLERWTAGREALQAALRELERIPGPTRYGLELSTLARDRGELWRDAGDAACRVGDYASAARAYARAADYPSMSDLGLTARTIFATARSEGPAAGAAYLVGLVRDSGELSAADAELLRVLARDPEVGTSLPAALKELRDSAPSARTRGVYSRALASVLPPEAALRELRGHASGDLATLRQLARSEFGDQGLSAAVGVVEETPLAAPRVAEAIYAERADIEGVLRFLEGHRNHDAAGLVRVYLEAMRGRLGEAARVAQALGESGRTGEAVRLARVAGFASLGRWGEAEAELRHLPAIGARMTADQRRTRAAALHALQRDGEAAAVLEPLAAAGDAEDGVQWAELVLAGSPAPATLDRIEAALHKGLEADPASDRAHSMLLSLYSASGLRADEAKLSAEVRLLREHGEGGRLLGLLRAQEYIRRGTPRDAETILMDLATRYPADGETQGLLATLWEQPGPRGEAHVVDPVAWLTPRHAERPSDPLLTSTLARVLFGEGKTEEAKTLIRDRLAAGDDPRLGMVLEGLLRKEPGGELEADRLSLARLEPLPRSLDSTLELAEVYTSLDRPKEAERVLLSDLPPRVTLTAAQKQRLVQVATALSGDAIRQGSSAEALTAARVLLDPLVERDLAAELHLLRLRVLAKQASSSEGELTEALRNARTAHPELGATPFILVTDTLSGANRRAEGAHLLEAMAGEPDANADVFLAWVRVVAQSGDASEARRLVESAQSAGQVSALVAKLTSPDSPPPREARAEAAYQMGLFAGSLGRRAESEEMYELALTYDADHAWANNNLGYALADRGEQLDRAEQLLERAYAGLPAEGSILDSLAWVRYRRGTVADATDESGTVRQGALSLLQRAYQTQSGRASPVVLDHYADALWSQGKKDDAKRVWEESVEAANRRLNELPPQSSSRQEIEDVRRKVRAKLKAMRSDSEMPYEAPGALPGPGTAASESAGAAQPAGGGQ